MKTMVVALGRFRERGLMPQHKHVVVKFSDDHPERLGERENQLVLEALRKAYPCNK